VDSLSYTNLGEPLQYQMGTSSLPAYVTDAYDPQTRNLTEQNSQTGTGQVSIDDLHYSYDNFGNVTSEADTPAGASGAADVQCFQYDYLGRLVQAWAQGSTGCASTPSAAAEGGAAPYWNAYNYNAVGNLTGITSTSPAGAATTTTDTYPAAGATRPHAITGSNVITPSASTSASYGYDADDNLLLTADPGTTTLYLPDEELALNTGTRTVTGTRYYTLGDTTVATRTGASSVAYLAGDQQDTDSVAIDGGTLGVTRRYFDPYGNPRGSAPSSFPAGEKAFVGGVNDTATGLTNLGAREYQPGTGSFISPDPLIKPYNPLTLNAYAYAADNPSTNSDPTGAAYVPQPGSNGGGCDVQSGCHAGNPQPKGHSPAPSDSGCPPTVTSCTVPAPLTNAGRHDYQYPGWVKDKPAPVKARPGLRRRKPGEGDLKRVGQTLLSGGKAVLGFLGGGFGLLGGAATVVAGGIDLGANTAADIVGAVTGAITDALCGQSFTADTKVLLASGTAIPIADLKPGDKVLATSVTTGKNQAEAVAAVLAHHDTDLYDLKVKAGTHTAVIHTTASHLFWDATTRKWVKASALHRGDHLRTPAGSIAIEVDGYTPRQHTGWMWDLTVPGDHDFYIHIRSVTSLLVHNDDCRPPQANSKENMNGGTYKTRNQALAAAERDAQNYRYGNVRVRIRLECSPTKCHVHLDVFNKNGEVLKTIHYTYHQKLSSPGRGLNIVG
jgi:RHS repeat-associated protein